MKTLKELYDLVNRHEAQQAPGSQTTLLGEFVVKYGYESDMLDQGRENEPISDDEYDGWDQAYAEHAEQEACYVAEDAEIDGDN